MQFISTLIHPHLYTGNGDDDGDGDDDDDDDDDESMMMPPPGKSPYKRKQFHKENSHG